MIFNLPKIGASGRLKVQVLQGEEVVKETDWINNLILDNGLDKVAVTNWSACLNNCLIGTGNTPTKDVPVSITASQSGTTVTASGAYFTTGGLGVGDVGKLIKFGSGEEAKITAVTSTTTATVNVTQTVASTTFVLYRVNQLKLTTFAKAQSSYYAPGASTTVTGSDTMVMTVVYDFAPETANTNYTEVGFTDDFNGFNPTAYTLFSRVLLPGAITVLGPAGGLPAQQLRLTYQLRVTVGPTATQSFSAAISGWPISPATNTDATSQLTCLALQGWNGTSPDFNAGYFFNGGVGHTGGNSFPAGEPSFAPSSAGIMLVAGASGALPTFGTTSSSAWTTFLGSGSILRNGADTYTFGAYTNGTFTRTKSFSWNVTSANSTNINAVTLGNGADAWMIIKFAQAQTKRSTAVLQLTFSWSWGRILT